MKVIGVCTQVDKDFYIQGKDDTGKKDEKYYFTKATTKGNCPLLSIGASHLATGVFMSALSMYAITMWLDNNKIIFISLIKFINF